MNKFSQYKKQLFNSFLSANIYSMTHKGIKNINISYFKIKIYSKKFIYNTKNKKLV